MKLKYQFIALCFFLTLLASGCNTEIPLNTLSTQGSHSLIINTNGHGSVINLANGINCQTNCSLFIPTETALTLMATAKDGYVFDHWEGLCENDKGGRCKTSMCNGNMRQECNLTMMGDTNLTAIFVGTVQETGQISVTWTAPTRREDGSELRETEIQKYLIYYRDNTDIAYQKFVSTDVNTPAANAAPTHITINNLKAGRLYTLAGVTIDTHGHISRFSNEISKVAI